VKSLTHYQSIADLFVYPDLGYPQRVKKVIDLLNGNYPLAAAELEQFMVLLPEQELRTMQELFTRTFDVQSATTLDIGYILFGEDYKRGELLANLNREHLAIDNDCHNELADHLPNILRLMGKLKDQELIEELVEEILVPALSMMISEFVPERIEKKNEAYKKHFKTLIEAAAKEIEVTTLYQHALKALYEVLKQDFSFNEKTLSKPACDFLHSVIKENEIEVRAEQSGVCYSDTCNTGEG
jgi:nitrate reductase assembly molybdenum cofactor insertion protein NarJ